MRHYYDDKGLSPNHVRRGFPQGNKGALLVGLVVTMVIFAILGAALLPINATSIMNLIGSNGSVKAYYLAEGGYRYAGSQFVHAGPVEKDMDDKLEELHTKTFTMADSYGTFKLEIYPQYYKTVSGSTATSLHTKIPGGFATGRVIPTSGRLKIGSVVYPYSSFSRTDSNVTFTMGSSMSPVPAADISVLFVGVAEGTTLSRGGNLTLTSGKDAFPPFIGSFRIGADNTVYAYRKKNGSVLENVTKLNSPQETFSTTVANGADVVFLKYLEIRSTGTVGSGVFTTARRVIYSGPIAALPGDQGGGVVPENIPDLAVLAADMGGTSVGNFETVTLGGDTALSVTKTTGGSGNQPTTEAYIMLPPGASNPVYQSWDGAGSYLSYDAQVKVATGDWSVANGYFINKPATYCAGITIRARQQTGSANSLTFYGLSYLRTHTGHGNNSDGIPDSMLPSSGYSDKALLVLWTRNGNHGNGDDNWLAYKPLDETGGTDYVVDNAGKLKDWSTIMLRVVEAASLRFSSGATGFQAGEVVTGATSGATGAILRKIKTVGGNDVILLNNITGTFTTGENISSTSQAAIANAEYRPRDNYIWAFYTDTGDHSSDVLAVNNTHLGQTRGTIGWPVVNVPDWTAAEDKFALVQWNASLNTAEDSSLLIMGYGKEAGAIIRSNKWVTDGYTVDSFPPEIGVVAMGKNATETYFDDLAFYLRGAADGGGGNVGFLPPVQE